MARLVYNLLLALLSPLLLIYYVVRLAKGKEDATHKHERWGNLATLTANGAPRFWVHCVSVGEVMAAVPVLRELRARFPQAFVVVSTITPGGREVALKQIPPADKVVYFPLDFPFAVRRALKQVRPDAVLLMEWEIWPNFLHAAKAQNARIAVLNGRVSDRGLRRGKRGSFFTKTGLDAVDLFAMQSAEDARRAVLVGANAAKVTTLGNTKFDEAVAPLTEQERNDLRADLGIAADAPVLVCGSTRPGEEEIIAQAIAKTRATFPNLFVIVAPRHLERSDEVAAVFEKANLAVRRRKSNAPPRGEPVLLLDTFGELGRVYAVADVAFVGGSLLPFGGQSVFQPLAQGVLALFGPHMNNQRDIAALSQAAGVGFQVSDAKTLANEVMRLFVLSVEEKQALRQKALSLIAENHGAAQRCVDAVAQLLEPAP